MRKYTNLCRAWRLLLDPNGVGRVSFQAFCSAARSIGFHDVARVWSALDANRSGFISMDEWDPVSLSYLMEFRKICYRDYAGVVAAIDLAMDTTKSRTVTIKEFERFCERHDFKGNVKKLMEALDLHQHGFLTADDLAFLDNWQGERSIKTTPHFELKSARLWAPPSIRKRSRRKPVMPKTARREVGEVEHKSRIFSEPW